MLTDYFTLDEFRAWAHDTTAPRKYEDPDVSQAQSEVVEALEAWAGTSWGTTGPRSTTETFYSGGRSFLLRYSPVVAVSAITFDGDPFVLNTDYFANLAIGKLWTPNPIADGLPLAVTYTYGTPVGPPWAIKRPVMAAAKSLLDFSSPKGGSKVPMAGLRSYSTETATFVFDRPEDGSPPEPWPWDTASSQAVRSYWGREREPVISVV